MSPQDLDAERTDFLPAFAAAAGRVFRESEAAASRSPERQIAHMVGLGDPVFEQFQILSHSRQTAQENLQPLTAQLLEHPEFRALAPRAGELEPMLLFAGGGTRLSSAHVVSNLFAATALQVYVLRLPNNESTFVQAALKGLDELRRAIKGEKIQGYLVRGIGGITIPDSTHISTPWGRLRSAPAASEEAGFVLPFRAFTTCILTDPRELTIRFDRAPSPATSIDSAEISADRTGILLPLSCVLASPEPSRGAVPLTLWSTVLMPIAVGFGYSMPAMLPRVTATVDVGELALSVEEWAARIEASHQPPIDVAARRLVSAMAHRLDRADALIDAVVVWENLVGTSPETTYRVTGALSKVLESDPAKRRKCRKDLMEVYTIRSKVVHGALVKDSVIRDAATRAIDVAVRALRDAYLRGPAWLKMSSSDRADTLLLEEP